MTLFDLLGSSSFLVKDAAATAQALCARLGFAPPKPHWILGERGRGIRVVFLRPNPSVVQNPTPIEIVDPDFIDPARDRASVQPHLAGIAASQGNRPIKVHATDIATSDIEGLIERVRRDGRRHWVHYDAADIPRVWMGVTPENPGDYCRDGDGGLHFEFLPTSALRLPATVADATIATTGALFRNYLVDDLSAVLDELTQLGTPFSIHRSPFSDGGHVLRVDHTVVAGTMIDFVEEPIQT